MRGRARSRVWWASILSGLLGTGRGGRPCGCPGEITIVAEQNVRFVSGLGDRVYILENGTVRYHRSMAECFADDEVRQAYRAL